MRESRVDEPKVEGRSVEGPAVEGNALHQCKSCDVTWYGDAETACWFCGSPGTIASATRRIVADENAA